MMAIRLPREDEIASAVLEKGPMGIAALGFDGAFHYLNPRLCKILGYAERELLRMSLEQTLRSEDLPMARTMINPLLRGDTESSACDLRFVRNDGIFVWLNLSLTRVEEPDVSPYLLALITDIGARKSAEERWLELAEMERQRTTELLQAVIDNTTDAIFVKDREGRYLLANAATERIAGKPLAEILGRGDADLFDAESAAWLKEEDRRVIEHGEAETREEVLTAAGETRTYLAMKAPYRDHRGEVVGLIGISRDITKRKRTEEALRVSEERLTLALQAAQMGVWEWDLATERLEWAPECYRILGIGPGVITREAYMEYIHPDDLERVNAAYDQAMADTGHCDVEYRVVRPDGEVRWVSTIGKCITEENGSRLRMIGVVRDITERMQLFSQLYEASKLESLGQLAGGIAHDFNNLLMVIAGFTELAQDEVAEDSPIYDALQNVTQATERASDLTRQLLTFARRQTVQLKAVNVNTLLLGLDKMLRRTLSTGIELVTLLEDDLWTVKLDPNQYSQVLLNLVINACNAMPGGGTLTIATANRTVPEQDSKHPGVPAGEYVQVSVGDTGVGMSAEVKARIFEPFFTTKAPNKGTGLGLATVYGIVQQARGFIQVQSEPGLGATFQIYLPRTEGAAEEISRDLTEKSIPLGTETILVVDDSSLVRSLAVKTLREHGYTVLEASHGEEALRMVEAYGAPVDLVFTDLVMPLMGGMELAKCLQQTHPNLRVLYTSGYSDEVEQNGDCSFDEAGLLMKPYTRGMLAERVRQILDMP